MRNSESLSEAFEKVSRIFLTSCLASDSFCWRLAFILIHSTKKLKLTKNTRKIQKLLNAGVSQNKISQIMGVQNATLRRFLNRIAQAKNDKLS